MFRFLANVLANAVAIWVAAVIVPDVSIGGDTMVETGVALVVLGAALAVVNAVIKPVIKFLTGCLYLLTFGLIALVVNAAMLRLAGWLAGKVDVSFDAGPFFWSTILAALVVTVVVMIVNRIFGEDDD
jgi:putative membrane protein